MMTKEDWLLLHNKLKDIQLEFAPAYNSYLKGKNAKIRAEGERNVRYAINNADFYIRQQPEAFELLTGGHQTHEFSKAIIYDEFTNPNYFGGDLRRFLVKIEEKIKSFE